METNTTTTPPPSANLTTDALAARFRQVNSPAAPAATTTPASTSTTAENQPAAESAEAAETDTTEATETAATTEVAPEETPEATETGEVAETTEESEETAPTEETEEIPKDDQGKVKRIHKLLGDRKAARDEAAALKQQLDTLTHQVQQMREGTPPNLSAIDRFSGHPAVKDIDAQLTAVTETLAWCRQNPEGGEVTDEKGKVHTFTAEQVQAMRARAEDDRTPLLVNRAGQVSKLVEAENSRRTKADAIAAQHYPWMRNQQSPEFQVALQIGQQVPGILQSPEMSLLLGDAVRGRLAREAAAKKPAVAPAKRPAPPNVTTAPAAAPKVSNTLESKVQAAEAEYQKSATMANYQKLTVLRDQLKASRQSRAA
jgi:hypothetical protein